MKKLTSLFVILALLMLCACGSKTGATADGAAAPDSGDIPEVCRVYEDYVLMEAIAPQNSRLPLASDAARGPAGRPRRRGLAHGRADGRQGHGGR